jgi:hypothetical protein
MSKKEIAFNIYSVFVEECNTIKAIGSVVMGLNCSIEQHDSDSFNSSR